MKRRILLFMVILGLSQLAKAQCVTDAYFDKPSVSCLNACFIAEVYNSYGMPIHYQWDFGDGQSTSSFSGEVCHEYAAAGTYFVKLTVTDTSFKGACNAYFERFVTIADTNLSVAINPNVSMNNAEFEAIVAGGSGDYVYMWSFDNWTYSFNTKRNIVEYNYHSLGWKNYQLTVTDLANNCSKTISDSVFVSNMGSCSLNANYTISFDFYDGVCNRVIFYANSDSPFSLYSWVINGQDTFYTANSPNYAAELGGAGDYNVELIVNDSISGCFFNYLETVHISDPISIPDFEAFHIDISAMTWVFQPFEVGQNAVTGGKGTLQYDWIINGENAGYGKHYVHQFTESDTGANNIKLHIWEMDDECQGFFEKTINVGSGGQNCVQIMDILSQPDSLNPNSIHFQTIYNGSSNYKIIWSFGDGYMDSTMNNPMIMHTYADTGVYGVDITFYDYTNSCQENFFKQVIVGSGGQNCVQIMDILSQPDSLNPNSILFQTIYNGSSNYKIIWSFGDGYMDSTMNNPMIMHTYADTGMYGVDITFYDYTNSCQESFSKQVIVGSGGQNCNLNVYNLNFNPLGGNQYEIAAYFSGITSDYKIIWNFGDGNIDSSINSNYFVHEFPDSNDYWVCAIVQDLANPLCSMEYCEFLKSGAQGNCMLSAFYTYWPLEGLTYQFESMISAPDTNYTVEWDFGNGVALPGQTISYTFPSPGMFNVCVKAKSTLDTNCYTTYCNMILVEDMGNDTNAIHAFFTYNIDTTGMGVQFFNYSNGEITDYSWSFGDGNYSTEMEPFHTYMYPGPYDVCLDIFNNNTGAWSSHCELIWIGSQSLCMADFGGQTIDSSLNFQFFNYSMNATHYNWEFGDGTFSQEFEPIHEYTAPGYYNVCLSIMDSSSGCMNFVCHDILVGQDTTACFVDFTYTFDQSTNTFEFMPSISGNITDIYWDFGDGIGSSDMNPTHIYAEQGIYWVTVSIFNQMSGCQAMNFKEVIYGNVSCNANFNYFVDHSTHTALFNNLSLGDNLSYFWDFGDGYASTLPYPQHTYQDQGTYWVTLSINNNNGCMDIKEEMITIGENLNCMVDYEYFVNTGSNEVFFNSLTTPNITNYFWNFGDGITSNESSPSHTYTEPGIYFVCLDAYDSVATNQPCANFVCKEIAVGVATCNASYNVFIDSTTNTAMFNNTSTGNYLQTYWEFGDGYFSFEENPVHQYVAPGYYFTTLSVWDPNNGCLDLHEELILVGSSGVDCQANYSYYVDNATNTVVFNNNSVIQNLGGQFWFFGDDSVSMDYEPVHTYAFPGIYDVCLSIWDPSGMCYNTFCDFVVVGDAINNINASFTYIIDTANNEVSFNNTSIGDIAGYYWDFGDGNFSNEDNPTHIYQTDSIYLAQLVAFGSSGITDDYYDVVNVNYGNGLFALFNFIIDSTDKANGHPVNFKGAVYGEPSRCAWTFGDGGSDSTAFNLTHVYQDTGMYYVCFTVIDHVTGDSSTQCQWLHVSDTTGSIVEFSSDIQFSSFPNPFRDEINIAYTLTKNEKVSIYIMDMFGNQVGEIQNNRMEAIGRKQIQFNAGNLSSGIYYLYVKIGDTNHVQKIVKL